MVTICAWCKRMLGKKGEGEEISHGICLACSKRIKWEAGPTLRISRDDAHCLPVIKELLQGSPPIRVVVEKPNRRGRKHFIDNQQLRLPIPIEQ